ncbi:hypothetical protein Gotur_034060 [Gossypium turneri]
MMISWPIYWSPPCSSGDMLRNRDAVVRSRERKKMYVKDFEMKSRYLEGECKRLSHVFQCFIAENQALQIFFFSSP